MEAPNPVPQHVPALSGVRPHRGVPGQPAPGQAAGRGVADSAHRTGEPRAGEGHGVGEFARGANVAWPP